MPTTTMPLPGDAKAAAVSAAETCSDFYAVADERYADMVATGKTISWAEMRRYLESRIAGKAAAPKPLAKTRIVPTVSAQLPTTLPPNAKTLHRRPIS